MQSEEENREMHAYVEKKWLLIDRHLAKNMQSINCFLTKGDFERISLFAACSF
jgi:hypothetical protein